MRCEAADSECSPGRLRLGMCEKHYRRWRATGSTESARLRPLEQYVVNADGCWIWTGARWSNGYGKTSRKLHGTRLAHRAFYLEHVGPIPDGMDLDHMCHNADPACVRGPECQHRACVCPQHLQPASRLTNLVRAIESQTLCENGLHDLTQPGAARPGTRQCVACWRVRYRAASRRYADKKRRNAAVTSPC